MRHSRPASGWILLGLAVVLCCGAAQGREAVGAWEGWASFADESPRRCYALAAPNFARVPAWASVSVWPDRNLKGEVHLRLTRPVRQGSAAIADVDGTPFALTARGADAWAATRDGERALVAAMRRGVTMRVESRDERGRFFVDGYRLAGAASAIDAALIACARPR